MRWLDGITDSQSLLKLKSTASVMPSNHLVPFSSCLQSFLASGSFLVSQLFESGGQSIGASASASVLRQNIQDRFSLGWTGLIPLQSKGLSRIFSNTIGQKHQFFDAQLINSSMLSCLYGPILTSSMLSFLYGPILTSIQDYQKNHSFDYTDYCWQSNVSDAFLMSLLSRLVIAFLPRSKCLLTSWHLISSLHGKYLGKQWKL